MELSEILEFIDILIAEDERIDERGAQYEGLVNYLKTPTSSGEGSETEDYKTRYEALREEYRARFREMIKETNDTPILEEEYESPDEDIQEELDMRQMDFDGEND